jgi:hypothetical protein
MSQPPEGPPQPGPPPKTPSWGCIIALFIVGGVLMLFGICVAFLVTYSV